MKFLADNFLLTKSEGVEEVLQKKKIVSESRKVAARDGLGYSPKSIALKIFQPHGEVGPYDYKLKKKMKNSLENSFLFGIFALETNDFPFGIFCLGNHKRPSDLEAVRFFHFNV